MYLTTLTAELVDENKNVQTRMVAGIILKNELSSQVRMHSLFPKPSFMLMQHINTTAERGKASWEGE